MELGPSLVHFSEGRTAFVDSDKLLYECNDEYKGDKSTDTFKLCESTFPDGLAINSFKVGFQWVEPVAHGNSVLIGPFKDNAAVLIDPSTGKASAGFKLDSLDIFDHTLVGENENGGLTVSELGGQHVESVDLPASPMRGIESGSFSADGKFLAFSGRSRSSIWDLTTQKRVSLMRPFRDLRIDGDNQMFAQYQQAHQRPGQNYRIDLTTGKAAAGPPYSIDQFQYGNVLITFQPGDKSGDVRSNVTMQVADISTGAPLWSKHFAQNRPTIWQTNDGELVYQMWVNSDTAISEMKHAGVKLIKTSDWKNEWVSLGMLIEVVDSRTGEVRRAVQAPQTRSTWSREDARWVSVFGDYLVVHGNQNNSTIYRVSDGKRLGAFYGRAIAGDAKLALVAATNRDQEITIYDLKNGKSLESVTVDHLPLTARFVAEKNTLLVLTANQRVFTLDLSAVAKTETAGAK
jgi:WD40 repeat protein